MLASKARNGWRTSTIVHFHAGRPVRFLARWRPQTWRCCGRNHVVAGEFAPVWLESGVTLTAVPHHTQCGGCGAIKAAQVTVTEVAS